MNHREILPSRGISRKDMMKRVARFRKLKGSDGGHRGIRSILEAFRTDAIPRVKIGVGRPGQHQQPAGMRLS